MVVGCVCEAEKGEEAEEGAEDNGSHRGVSAVGFTEGFFDEVVTIELRDSKEGAARDVEAGVSKGLLVRLWRIWDDRGDSPGSISGEQKATVKECRQNLDRSVLQGDDERGIGSRAISARPRME